MRTLIYSGVFAQDEIASETVRLWAKLVDHLNPNIDVVIYDSRSPFDPKYLVPERFEIVRFPDNPGHLSQGGKDGAGRTFCQGIIDARERGYDYAVHLESDFFLTMPIGKIIERMDKAGVKVGCAKMDFYQFFEFGICAMNVPRMVATDFVKRYDWENRTLNPIPEIYLEQLFGDDLFILPLRGLRNDRRWLNMMNFDMIYPYGPCDFLTHAYGDDFKLYPEFLRRSGINLA